MNRSLLLLVGIACNAGGALHAQALGPPPRTASSVLQWWEGAATFGTIAVTSLLDEGLRRAIQNSRSQTGDNAASVVRRMGQPEVFVTIPGVLFLSGVLSRRAPLRHAAARIAGSLAVAGVLVTTTKFVVGRQRPIQTEEQYVLKPFSGASAFPSGHTTMAFALATSLADEIRRPWATVALMAVAAGTGWSRINDNEHWLTDVMAGAALGITSAQIIERRWRIHAVPLPSGIAFRIAL